MLGEKIGEITGKVTMQRVVPNLGGDPKMETTFQATGSVLGTLLQDRGELGHSSGRGRSLPLPVRGSTYGREVRQNAGACRR